MAVVLGVAGAGGWLLRPPAAARGAVAASARVDLDPPAVRARREAAIALARMPDDPWTFAESLAASSPASAAATPRERCGIEDGPKFSEQAAEDEPRVEIRAPSTRFLNAEARIDAVLRSSGDPLDGAVADLLNIGDMRSESGQVDAVVQQAAATTDPRVYAMGYGLCHPMRASAPGCAAITAERWAQLDAGNGTPWLPLLAQARDAGDAAAVADAMTHLASAARFDVYSNAPGAAVARHAPQEGADLAAYADVTIKANGMAASFTAPGYASLTQVCRNHAGGDERLEQACRAVSDGMFEHSDTLTGQLVGAALSFQTTGDAARRDFLRAERLASSAHWSPATGLSPCQDLRDLLKRQRRVAEIGEVAALRERARQFVTP